MRRPGAVIAPTAVAADLGAGAPRARCVLVVGADADLAALIEQWLRDDGIEVRTVRDSGPDARLDLVIADLPFPSRSHVDLLRASLAPQGHVPILVLSPTVFASVDCCGPAARALGADGLLPKPTAGAVLRRAVQRLIDA